MRLLVTGGSGFVGRRFVPCAVRAGHSVVALSRSDAADQVLLPAGASILRGDLDDPASIDDAFFSANADALVNIASLGYGHAPVIVAATEAANILRAVFVSTTAVATRLNAGSKSVRLAAEHCIRDSSLDWTIVRPTMIYGGADDRNLARLVRFLRRWPLVPVPGGGERLQQPVHVEDLAAALLAAITSNASVHRIYDLAGPEAITFRQLIATTAATTNRRVLMVPVPLRPAIAVARAYERVAQHPRLRAEQLARLAEDKSFTIADAARDFGFAPRTFADGIRAESDLI